jgi:hypothetical protein
MGKDLEGGFMSTPFPPNREADLVTWTQNFSTLISATPAVFGISVPAATAYATVSGNFVTAYNVANTENTRTRVTVAQKNAAKATMIASARSLIRTIQGTASVTPAQKIELAINPRDIVPSPIPAPANPPLLQIVSAIGRTVRIRLKDSVSTDRRGRPPGVAGATVFSFVGATAPSDPSEYHYEGNTSLTVVDVQFPDDVPSGAQVWLTAFWRNARGNSGPACTPAGTNLPGGAALPEAA